MESELKGIIRVLVVEDAPLICKVLTDILNSDPRILVVGTAHDGKEAAEIVPHLKPDVITMDINMPVMDGFEATKQIMAYNPTPILIVSSSVFKGGMDKAFKAISYGALDVIEKCRVEKAGDKKSREELIEKIRILSGVKVIHHPLAKLERRRPIGILEIPGKKTLNRVVAIVASTGGPHALLEILRSFPKDFPCGIVIVQHISSGFVEGMADWLNSECHIKVRIAEDSEQIKQGTAYIAPCDLQIKAEKGGKIHLSNEPPQDGHRPSGDILLESVSKAYGEGAVGVILTGMGRDGAVGMEAVKRARGRTIAEDEKSCVVFGMPKAAIEMDTADKVLPLEKIADGIIEMLRETVVSYKE